MTKCKKGSEKINNYLNTFFTKHTKLTHNNLKNNTLNK